MTFSDDYWTVYFKKPFPHFHSFNLGMVIGCTYFSFKYHEKSKTKLVSLFDKLKVNKVQSISFAVVGFLLQLTILLLDKHNNNNPKTKFVWNLFFLLTSRPFFILGFTLIILPILLRHTSFEPVFNFMSNKYWVPYARLTYGVFLCNSIFMQFRSFNLSHGDWVQQFDLYLLFAAFATLSFCFSFATYLFIEAPMANLLNVFLVAGFSKDSPAANNSVFYHS